MKRLKGNLEETLSQPSLRTLFSLTEAQVLQVKSVTISSKEGGALVSFKMVKSREQNRKW